jgi:molybdopterin/thiamine biosynthesis adenylyltransferase
MSEHQAQRTKALLEQLTKKANVEALFPSGRVAVGISPSAAATAQGQLMFSFAVNLLARLFPVVQELVVVVPDAPVVARLPRWPATTLDQHLHLLLTELSPPVRWSIVGQLKVEPTCSLWVSSPTATPVGACFVGSENWYVHVSPNEPQPVGGYNPVGAYAAACFGVAEVWKKLLLPHRELFIGAPIVPLERTLSFSTFTYRARPGDPNPQLPGAVNLGRLTLIGLGAGGGAAAFTLATLPGVNGVLNLIEPDEIVESNLNRYVFAAAADAFHRLPKSAVIQQLFRGLYVTARPFAASFREVRPVLTVEDLEYVVAAVHSREARRELQFETPRVLWDAGATQDGEFRIWRLILGQTECMFCKHPISQDDPEQRKAEQLTQLLGLSAETWRRKIRDNEHFSGDEVREIERRYIKGAEFDLPRVGQRFGDWETEQCGRLKLPEMEEEIPLPFAPVLAGVLIAGEIIKEMHFPDSVLDSYYWNTLLGHFVRRHEPHRRFPRRDCSFCADPIYLSQYQRRWRARERYSLAPTQ